MKSRMYAHCASLSTYSVQAMVQSRSGWMAARRRNKWLKRSRAVWTKSESGVVTRLMTPDDLATLVSSANLRQHLFSQTTRRGFTRHARCAVHWTDQPTADHGEGDTGGHKITVASKSTRPGRSTKSCSASDCGHHSWPPDDHLQSEPMHRILPSTFPLFNHGGTEKTR